MPQRITSDTPSGLANYPSRRAASASFNNRRIPLELNPGKIQHCFLLSEIGLCRVELSLIGSGVDHEKDLPLLQVCAVPEVPFDNSSAHLGHYTYGLERCIPANLIQVNGDVLRDRLRDAHQRRGHGGRSLGLSVTATPSTRQQHERAQNENWDSAL
jgi:hypothetical protein